MSGRSSSMATDKEQIAKVFMRSFIETVENFIDSDAQLDVVYRCVTAFSDSMSADTRPLVLKKILMHFMRKFPVEFEDNIPVSDEYIRKTLELWRIFGKCSKTMGPVAILEKVEDSYAGRWQYYQIYAESLIEEGQTDSDQLYKTFRNCMEHCDLTNEQVRKIFGPKIMARVKFPEQSEEDECTVQFMETRQNDIRKSIAARRRSSLALGKLQAILECNEDVLIVKEFSQLSTLPTQPSTSIRKQQMPVDDSKSTAVGLKEDHDYDATTTNSPPQKPPVDDFTVFKDPTVALGQRRSFDADANSPTVCGNHKMLKKLVDVNDPVLTSTPDTIRKPVPFRSSGNYGQ